MLFRSLFAGSGMLGLESLSRGAAAVTFVDSDPRAVQALRERLADWHAVGGSVIRADAQQFLAGGCVPRPVDGSAAPPGAGPFDLVFLDPPFAAGLLPPVAQALEQGGWLAPDALLYVEAAAEDRLPDWPPAWQPLRSGSAGAVGYHLLRREGRSVANGQPT